MPTQYNSDWLSYTILFLNALTTCLHGVGAWLIINQRSTTTPSSQSTRIKNNVELLSMSISIIASCTVSTTTLILEIESSTIRFAFPSTTALLFPFYCSMIFLTLQRFFAIRLHLRYETSWIHLQRANITLASWFAGIVFLATTLSLVYTDASTVLTWSLVGFIIFGLMATNIVFITVYVFIYIKYRKATQTTQKSLYQKKKAKIFIPFIICASFFFFGTLPHAFMPQINDKRYSYLWFDLDCITNSLVYIFANPELRRRWRRWWKKGQVDDSSNSARTENTTTMALR